MKAALLGILLVSICLLHAGADIPVYPDLDIQKLAGTWYNVADTFTGVDPNSITPINDIIMPMGGGDFSQGKNFIANGQCKMIDFVALHTDQPGVFNVPPGNKIIRFVDVNYESYHIVHVEEDGQGLLQLFTREREASDDVKNTFAKFAEMLGFGGNHISYLPLAGKSEFGEIFKECTNMVSIMVLQMTLTVFCHIF